MSVVIVCPCVSDLLDMMSMSMVTPISLERYMPMPPGFWVRVDRSPPKAVNAPPIDMNRAVPRRSLRFICNPSTADCPMAARGSNAEASSVNLDIFMIMNLS